MLHLYCHAGYQTFFKIKSKKALRRAKRKFFFRIFLKKTNTLPNISFGYPAYLIQVFILINDQPL